MAVQPIQYETLLSTCSEYAGALALLRLHRPYLEVIPSMRRPQDSIVTIPLPNIRVRQAVNLFPQGGSPIASGEAVSLPCDVALLMCDPEWKIKTGVELLIFIHRPQEDFSDLLMRWRRTQILMEQGYEWMLPARHSHLLSDGADVIRPLFIVFPESPSRILKGLQGAGLPAVACHELGSVPATPPPEEPGDLSELVDGDLADLGDLSDLVDAAEIERWKSGEEPDA